MKVIIAGSRNITGPLELIPIAIRASHYDVTEIVSGAASGVDSLAEEYAILNKIRLTRFPVSSFEWAKGRDAGLRRNERMAKYADALIAIWDGQSPGTNHMINAARSRKLLVYIHRVEAP
jgi:hypothetical protein